ncbi:MAG: hypothetical protein KDK40_04550, partial [Chlamydiia bacterium]|nr:hypothetical protein [Chlamydiia bacterium]
VKAFNGLIHHIAFQNLSNDPELLLLLLQGSLSVCEQTKGEPRNEALLRIESVLKTLLSLPELDQNHAPFIPLIDRLTRLNLKEFKTPFSIYQGALQLGVKIRAPLPQMREWLLRGIKPSPQFPSSLFEPLTAKNVEWLDRLMHSLALSEREACSPELYKIYYDYIVAEYERKQLSLNDYVLLFSSSATRNFITPALMEHLWERIGAFDDEKE